MRIDLAQHERVGLVEVHRDVDWRVGLDVADTGVLEEVAAEGVARVGRRAVATHRHPGAAFEHRVLAVCARTAAAVSVARIAMTRRWCGYTPGQGGRGAEGAYAPKVGVEARPAPLKHVDGALRCEVLEVDVAGGTVPVLRTTKRSADRDVMAMVAVMMMVVINRQRQDRDR